MGSEFIQAVSGFFDFTTGRLVGFLDRTGAMMSLGETQAASVTAGAAVSLTNATTASVASVQITTGDWDVRGVLDVALVSASSTTWKAGISGTAATFDAQDTAVAAPFSTTTATATFQALTPTVRVSVTKAQSPKTMFLVAQVAFSEGTETAYGSIVARRAN